MQVQYEFILFLLSNHRTEKINQHHMFRSQITDRILSNKSTPYAIDLQDNSSKESIASSSNCDIIDFNSPEVKQSFSPFIFPTHQFLPPTFSITYNLSLYYTGDDSDNF